MLIINKNALLGKHTGNRYFWETTSKTTFVCFSRFSFKIDKQIVNFKIKQIFSQAWVTRTKLHRSVRPCTGGN